MKFVYYVMLFLYPAVCFKRGKDFLEAGNKSLVNFGIKFVNFIEHLFVFDYNNE